MLKYFMNYDKDNQNYTLTNVKTNGATIYSSIEELINAVMKGPTSSYVYAYELTDLADAIVNTLFRNGYTERYQHEFTKGMQGKLNNFEFMVVGSAKPKRTVNVRIRRTTKIQVNFFNAREIFGKNNKVVDIAKSFGCEDNLNLGMSKAIMSLEAMKHTGMTVSINARKDMIRTCFGTEEAFNGTGETKGNNDNKLGEFPKLSQEHHDFVMSSLQGGLCYYNEDYLGDNTVKGKAFDVNSLYPSIMVQEFLPYGKGEEFEGMYQFDKKMPLFFHKVKVAAIRLKEDGIPCIKNRKADKNINEEDEYYINADNIELVLNNVDMDLIFENYDVYDMQFIGGLKYKAKKGRFNKFVFKWSDKKVQAKKKGDGFQYFYSKLMLNSLTGGFSTRNDRMACKYESNSEIIKDKSKVKFIRKEFKAESNVNSTVYAPVGCFITSYGRQRLIAAIKANKENFIYSDSDSIYVKGDAVGLNVDEFELGAWKEEYEFNRINILGKKKYCVEKVDGTIKTVFAGCPDDAKNEQVKTYDDFKIGKVIKYTQDNWNQFGIYEPFKNCEIVIDIKK